MKASEKMQNRVRLRELDIELAEQHRLMESAPLTTPLEEVDQMAEDLADLSAEYTKVESLVHANT